jgi:hypothetical protein
MRARGRPAAKTQERFVVKPDNKPDGKLSPADFERLQAESFARLVALETPEQHRSRVFRGSGRGDDWFLLGG